MALQPQSMAEGGGAGGGGDGAGGDDGKGGEGGGEGGSGGDGGKNEIETPAEARFPAKPAWTWPWHTVSPRVHCSANVTRVITVALMATCPGHAELMPVLMSELGAP